MTSVRAQHRENNKIDGRYVVVGGARVAEPENMGRCTRGKFQTGMFIRQESVTIVDMCISTRKEVQRVWIGGKQGNRYVTRHMRAAESQMSGGCQTRGFIS